MVCQRKARLAGRVRRRGASGKIDRVEQAGAMRQKNELRPYQDRIATHLYENDEAMVVLRPGGGKTISALTAIAELLRDNVIRHALVIAPKRVARSVWPD